MVEDVWCVVWSYKGHKPFCDFWNREDAFDFAARIAESADRYDPQVFQHETPEPDPAVKARIAERLQQIANGRAYMASMETKP